MPDTSRRIMRSLKRPDENSSAIEELTRVMVEELRRKNKNFIRHMRERAFLTIQRKCEPSIWGRLISMASDRLNERAAAKARSNGREVPPTHPHWDWNHEEISSVMARIDTGLVSNARTLAFTPQSDNVASLSLPTLIAMLIDLKKNWEDLGQLPPFDWLRNECCLEAIGTAQHEFCEQNQKPHPTELKPSLGELQILNQLFAKNRTELNGNGDEAERESAIKKTWGVGWLVARSVLGMRHDSEDDQ